MSNACPLRSWTFQATALVACLSLTALLLSARSRDERVSADVVEGREFRLVDAEERLRARLGVQPDGGAGLSLYDSDGIERAWFGLALPGGNFDVDESVEIVLRGSDGAHRVVLAQKLLRDGRDQGSLVLLDGSSQPAAALRTGRDGTKGPELELGRDDFRFFVDASLRNLTMANMVLDEETGVRTGDETFSVRLGGASPEDLSAVSLTRQGSKVEVSLREWGEARIRLVDDDGEREVAVRDE